MFKVNNRNQKHRDKKHQENTINGHKSTWLDLSQDEIADNNAVFQSQLIKIMHKKGNNISLHLLPSMKQFKTILQNSRSVYRNKSEAANRKTKKLLFF